MSDDFNGSTPRPDVPGGLGLKVKHLESVLHYGAMALAVAHEGGQPGIIDKIVENVTGGEETVRNSRCAVNGGIHAQGSAVDNDAVGGHHFRGQVIISQERRGRTAADAGDLQTQTLKTINHSAGGTARTEHKGTGVNTGTKERTDGTDKADDISVVAHKADTPFLADGLHHIDGTDLPRFGGERGKVRKNRALMGDGNVETAQVGNGKQSIYPLPHSFILKITIDGIAALGLKLFRKITCRETMAKRIAQQSVLFHDMRDYDVYKTQAKLQKTDRRKEARSGDLRNRLTQNKHGVAT